MTTALRQKAKQGPLLPEPGPNPEPTRGRLQVERIAPSFVPGCTVVRVGRAGQRSRGKVTAEVEGPGEGAGEGLGVTRG